MTILEFFIRTFALCKEYRVCVLVFKLTRIDHHSRILMCSFPLMDCFSTTSKIFRAPFCGEICKNNAITNNRKYSFITNILWIKIRGSRSIKSQNRTLHSYILYQSLIISCLMYYRYVDLIVRSWYVWLSLVWI